MISIVSCVLALGSALAAPYPQDGLPTQWVQPDGTNLKLRVFGDEFYARTTTEDGHTVVFSAADKTYYYAASGADGSSVGSSGVRADRPPPFGLAKHLKEARGTAAAVREANIRKFTPDRAGNWAARVKAAQLRRARDSGPAPAPAPGEGPNDGPTPAPNGGPLGAPISGAKVGLLLLVQFPDDPATVAVDPMNFPAPRSKMVRYSNETGYTDDGNTGSIRDYFFDQSNGQLTHTQVVSTIVTLPHPRNYYNYSDYPTNATLADLGLVGRQLVAEAIAKLKTDGFDFSTLSVDENDRVLATSLLFAGDNSGNWLKGLWPHSWSLAGAGINVGTVANPRYLYRYQITDMPTSAPVIGTVCHELGHLLLGYPDFYDTDASDGDSAGVGEHSLMGSGNHLNGGKTPAPIDLYLKDVSGWANITDITPTDSLDVSLPSTGNRGYRIRKPGTTTEYFLIENRGAGDKWSDFCRDKGIAIWHVDETVFTDNKRQQMTAALHYELSIEQADGFFDLENNQNRGDASDFFDLADGLFNNGTNPNAHWWGGTASGISISVISSPGASMNVRFGAGTPSSILTLSPASQLVAAEGASPSFAVTSNVTWSWSGVASWITSSEPVTQSGNQTFTFTVAPNTGTTTRSATITLIGGGLTRTHTVTQPGVVADDHGNTTAAATVVGQNSTTSGIIETAGDNDYFRINVTGSGTLQVETTGTADTFGHLLDATGVEITTDDDTGADSNFRISQVVTAGTYYVRVRHFDPLQTGSYQFVCSFSGTPTLTLSPATLSVVAGGSTSDFSVLSNTTWVWTADQLWVTTSEPVSQSGNQTFTYSTLANTGTASRTATFTLTGGGFTRTHVVTQAGADADDHGNTIATATLVGQNSTTDGNIETTGDNDYFRINVTGIGTLLVQTTGGTDTYGYLLDVTGVPLIEDDDAGAENNFQLSYAVTAGTYYVRVRHYAAGTGDYQLVTSFTSALALSVSPATQSVAAGGATTDFTVSSNATWTWSSNAAWLASGEAASQSGNQTFTHTAAANPTAASRTGVITLTAGALTATVTVSQDPQPLPDLMDPGTYYSVSPATLAPGEALSIAGDVRNQGNAPSGVFMVKFYLSTDTTITTGDIYLGERELPSLVAGSNGIIDKSGLIVPLSINVGTYHAGWIYDPAGTVVESNEANNTAHVAAQTVAVVGNTIKVITQSLADGSASSWGALEGGNPTVMDEASLTTVLNGASPDAFDGVGILALSPGIIMPPLNAPASSGPLSSTATSGGVTATRQISLVSGRHATDEQITFTNVSGVAQPVTLAITDDYGSDNSTRVHGTSSGDTTVTTADNWFVSGDQALPGAVSFDPSLMVSWRFSGNLPVPTFPSVPLAAGGIDTFTLNFGTFSLAAGQSVSVTLRRELFDSAALALANGRPINAVTTLVQTLGDTSRSVWGVENSNNNFVEEATLSTQSNGDSGDAFDGVGVVTAGPSLTLPALVAPNTSGPLASSATSGTVTATHQVSLVGGRHATDEIITLANISGAAQSVTLRIDDNYGSDGATTVHGTSSGDATVTTADGWFVVSDQAAPAAISGDPAMMVSWKFSTGLPTPTFPAMPAAGMDAFAINFGSFSLAVGQTVTVTIRRELFDSAALALANGLPLVPGGPQIVGTTLGKPTWNRPVDNGANAPGFLSNTGTAVPYDAIGFSVATSGIYQLTSTATSPLNWDNYLFLYAGTFSAGSPLTNGVLGNDDFPAAGTAGFSVSLTAGTAYFAVTTGFENTDAGAYSLAIAGPGTVSLMTPNLASLVTGAGTLSPAFAPGTLDYTASVGSATAAITVTPVAADGAATIQVRVNGGGFAAVNSGSASASLPLNVGSNPIQCLVTAGNGATRTYTVMVTRRSSIEDWRLTWYGAAANSGNAANLEDPHHTGVPNLAVFALFGPNQDPALVQASQLPTAQIIGGNLVLSFTHPAGVSGITYGGQWSPTMAAASWLPVTDTGAGGQHTFSVPVGNNPQIFMRLWFSNP